MSALWLNLSLLAVVAGVPIQGRVVDDRDQPVAGAVVKISTAKPRQGPQMTCPSCYVDCGKSGLTDAEGRFRIDDVSTKLLFRLVSGKLGYQGESLADVDPMEPDLTLRIRRVEDSDPNTTLSGRLIDLQEAPIAGGLVTVRTVRYQDGRMTGPSKEITPAAVTDTEGRFALTVGVPIRDLSLRVEVAGHAPCETSSLMPGVPDQVIRVGPGASLMGRVLWNDRPVSGLKLGLVQSDRSIGKVLTPEILVTDPEGRFRWDHLPPEVDYAIYSEAGQEAAAALRVSLVEAPAHGQLADLGDINAGPSHRMDVQIQTVGGEPIPKNAYASLARSRAWHSARESIPTESDARVTFSGLASEQFSLGIRVPGYHVIKTQPVCQFDLNERLQIFSDTDQSILVLIDQ